MPSDRPEIHQGYLRKMLVNGTKPFRYRSGIRTLLGLREDPDARIAYPLALPLAGFNYVGTASFLENPSSNKVGTETSHVFSETSLLESENAEPPQKAQLQKTKASPSAKIETQDASAMRGISEPISLSDTIKASGRSSGDTRKPFLADRKAGQQGSGDPNAGKLHINIPGFSEKQLRFPALAPQKIEETPSSKTPVQVSEVQAKKELQPPSAAINTMPDAAIHKSGASEKSGSVLPSPFRKRAVFKHGDVMSVYPMSEFKPSERHASVDEDIAGKASPYRNNRALTSSRQAGKVQFMPNQPRQHAAEAQIEQLRQGLSTLKRKTISREAKFRDSQNMPQAEPAERNRPASSISQPVVIVNRSYTQRLTPSAFWERSYLSHVFRLRRLR